MMNFFQALRAMNCDDPRKALRVAETYFNQPTKQKKKK